MRLLLLALAFCLPVWGDTAWELPGSRVIELKDAHGRVYPIYIKLPRSWRRNPERRYPVVYLTDAPYSFPLVSGATR